MTRQFLGIALGALCSLAEPTPHGRVDWIHAMREPRAAHCATLLQDGRILITGGMSGIRTAEIFDPVTNTYLATGPMQTGRAGHTATLLANGKVLVAGGYNGNYLDSAELYDPATGRFTSAGTMVMPRSGHTAVMLQNGKVLLVGGVGTGWSFLSSAELYDPGKNSFTATGSLSTPRESHTATLLRNGNVLITGGHRGRRSSIVIYPSAEIYDPATARFRKTSQMIQRRHKHDAVLLADGRVLIVGGADERDRMGAYKTAEIYDPAAGSFAPAAEMHLTRYKLNGTTVTLSDGRVLVACGAAKAELFDPPRKRFEIVPGDFGSDRLFATATRLPDDRVLITGGYDETITISSGSWLYHRPGNLRAIRRAAPTNLQSHRAELPTQPLPRSRSARR